MSVSVIIKFDDKIVGTYRGSKKDLENATSVFLFNRNNSDADEYCQDWDQICEQYNIRLTTETEFDLVVDDAPLKF